MFRSIRIKLILAFVFVSLVGAGLSAFFIQRRTQLEFDRFLNDQGRSELIDTLSRYYAWQGSWQDVESYVFVVRSEDELSVLEPEKGALPDDRTHPGIRRLPYMLADLDGRVLLGNPELAGKSVNLAKETKFAIQVNRRTVGWLVAIQSEARLSTGTPASDFLQGINRVILLAALIAIGIALILGGVLSGALTNSLSQLTQAAGELAQGRLGYQVQIDSQDEVGELAGAFNKMSSDLATASRSRQQMTADIAHDLRTPLSVLLGYSEALADGKLEGTPEVYAVLHQETRHLKLLIDDLRTLSLADAGELPLNREEIAPLAMLQRTAAALRPLAECQQVTIEVDAANDLPLVSVDPERMAQVLGNLVSNALRYTQEGGTVALCARHEAGRTVIQVRDTGSGISPEDLPYIFNRFYRGNKSREANGEAGLGLAIAKSLVQAHGGGIIVDSQLGRGTTFTISL